MALAEALDGQVVHLAEGDRPALAELDWLLGLIPVRVPAGRVVTPALLAQASEDGDDPVERVRRALGLPRDAVIRREDAIRTLQRLDAAAKRQ
ncbi:MAG: hypothetical protein RMJ05_09540 [Thermomicrobium sp.]|nr:hypothetical protein [Thermomicrobium sp.]